jgi:hypothetical protein
MAAEIDWKSVPNRTGRSKTDQVISADGAAASAGITPGSPGKLRSKRNSGAGAATIAMPAADQRHILAVLDHVAEPLLRPNEQFPAIESRSVPARLERGLNCAP